MGLAGCVGLGAAIDGFFVLGAFHPTVYVIQPFSFSTAAVLIVITSVSGFFIAFIFGVILNELHRYQGLE